MSENKSTKSTFLVVFTSLVIDLLSFTLILPLMPSILDYYAKNDSSGFYSWIENKVAISQQLIGSPQEFNKVLFGGLIGSWFSLLQYITQPIVGSLSDIYGRKPLLLLCLSGISISYVFWSLSSQMFTIFLISRTIGGLSKGNISLSTAIMTDVSDESNRGKAMALIGISFSIGFIIGPVLGASFAVWSRSQDQHNFFQLWPALFALTLSLINVIFIWRYFKESLPTQRARSISSGIRQAYDYMSPLSLFSFRPVTNIQELGIESDFVTIVIGCALTNYLSFLLIGRSVGSEAWKSFILPVPIFIFRPGIHVNIPDSPTVPIHQGKLYLYAGLIMTLMQGSFVRRVKPGNELKTVLFGISSIIPSFILIGLSSNQIQLYMGLTLYAISSATVVPCLTTIISSFGPSDQKGVILGIFRSIGALARALGPVSASLVFWRFGSTVCYCLGALLLIFPLLMAYDLNKLVSNQLKLKSIKKNQKM